MSFRVQVVIQVVNAEGAVVNSHGRVMKTPTEVGALSTTVPISEHSNGDIARERLNNLWAIIREIYNLINKHPARS